MNKQQVEQVMEEALKEMAEENMMPGNLPVTKEDVDTLKEKMGELTVGLTVQQTVIVIKQIESMKTRMGEVIEQTWERTRDEIGETKTMTLPVLVTHQEELKKLMRESLKKATETMWM